ncbi:MAG: hypothetical protein U1D30_12580 [Planctomycetota bacterium]
MSLISACLLLLSLPMQSAAERDSLSEPSIQWGPISIQRLHVPRDRIGLFLPKSDVARFWTKGEFEQLLRQYRSNHAAAVPRQPVECRLQARLNLQTGRIEGTSEWRVPAGNSVETRFTPWNLGVIEFKGGDATTVAGITPDGTFLVRSGDKRDSLFQIRWELAARAVGDSLIFEPRIPSCAIAVMELTVPRGWKVRTLAKVIPSEKNPEVFEIYFGGSPGLTVELSPPSANSEGRSIVTWQSDQTFDIDEAGVRMQALIQFEALHEQTESVSLLFDEQFRPRELQESTPAQWRRSSTGDGRVRWTAEFRRPPLGAFHVRLEGHLPVTLGQPWNPPLLVVENAVPRGETITFSLAPTLSIDAVDPGKYQQTFSGLGDDKNYRLVFTSAGGSASGVGPGLLRAMDVVNWRRFCARLDAESDQAAPSVAKRILSLMDEPSRRLVEDLADGGDAGTQAKLLASFQRLLARRDFYDEASFSKVELRPQTKEALADRQPSESQNSRLNRMLLEDAFPDDVSRGNTVDVSPSIVVSARRPDVEVRQSVLFDTRRDQIALIGQLEWRPVQGTLYQPVAWVPPGWLVSRVQAEPESRLLRYRTEPADDGGTLVWLQLTEGLPAGERLVATIFAEPEQKMSLSEGGPREVALPEIRSVEFPPTGTSVYTIYLDSLVSHGKDGLPPERQGAVEIRGIAKPPDANQYSFNFASPLREAVLTVLAERPRYHVEQSQRWQWLLDRWQAELRMEVTVEQGAVRSLLLTTTRPLPPDFQWSVEGPGNRVQRMEQLPTEKDDPLFRYRVEFAVPTEKRIRLLATWTLAKPDADLPLFEAPEAERFQAVLEVLSATGQTVGIDAEGIIDADPREIGAGANAGLLWTGAYVRLPKDASVALTAPSIPKEARPLGTSQALIHARTFLEEARWVHHVFLRLDCRSPQPLVLEVPRDAKLWYVLFDDESLEPQVKEGKIEIAKSLAEGPHAVEIAYSQDSARWWGMPMAELDPPLKGWKITAFLWDVERYGEAHLLATGQLELKARFHASGPHAHDFEGTLNPSTEGSSMVRSLDGVLAKLDARQQQDPLGVLLLLEAALPSGWTMLVDPSALPHPERVPSGIALPSGTGLLEWLKRLGLGARIVDKTLVLSSRQVVSASGSEPSPGHDNSWFFRTLEVVRQQGVDPTGRFMTPAALAARFEDPMVPAWGPVQEQRSGNDELETWSFAVVDPSPAGIPWVAMVPRTWSIGFSRGLALFVGLIVFYIGKHWDVATCRQLLLSGLVFVVLLVLVGGLAEACFGLAAWFAVLILSAWLAWRHRPVNAKVTAVGAAMVLALAVTDQGRAQPLVGEPATDSATFRVLVPYDPLQPAKDLDQVILSERLLALITKKNAFAPGVPLLISNADYDGILENDNQIRWRARLEVFSDPAETYPRSVSLAFGKLRPIALLVDGQPVDYLPPGLDARLDFKLPNPGLSNVQFEFLSPVLGTPPWREMDFQIPPAPTANFRLLLGTDAITLAEESEPSGIAVEQEDGRVVLRGNLGPTSRVRLRWQQGSENTKLPEHVDVVSAHLFNVTPSTRDLFSVFRYDMSGGGIRSLSFAISPDLVVRRLEGDGLRAWRVVEEGALSQGAGTTSRRKLLVTFQAAKTMPFDVRVHSMVRVANAEEVSLPEIVPLEIRSEKGAVGIRLPPGWSEANQTWRNAEPETVEKFMEAWKSLGQVPPDGIAIAKKYSQRPLELTLNLQRPSPKYAVRQVFYERPSPHSRVADVTAAIEITKVEGPLGQVLLRLPAGFQVQRVTGDGLYQWFTRGRNLILLPTREVTAGWQARILGRFLSNSRPDKGQAQVAFAQAGFEWPGVESIESRWTIDIPPTFQLSVDAPRDVQVEENKLDSQVLTSTSASHSFRLLLKPIEPKVDVRSVTVVTVGDDGIILDGRFDIQYGQGSPDRLQFRTPRWMSKIRWQISDARPPTSESRGRDLVWTIEPNQAFTGPIRVDWQVNYEGRDERGLAVPDVQFVGHPASDQRILLHNLSTGVLEPVDVEGLVAAELPAGFGNWPAGVAAPLSPAKLTTFRASGNDWRLILVPRRQRASSEPLIVHHSDVDVYQSSDGSIHGASKWEVFDQSAGEVTIEIPPGTNVEQLLVGGVAVPYPKLLGGKLHFPVFRKASRHEIVLYWFVSAERIATESGVAFPRLVTRNRYTTLVALRLGANQQGAVVPASEKDQAKSMDRSQWLFFKLQRITDRLAERLGQWESRPGPFIEERIIDLLSRARILEQQLRESLRMSPEGAQVLEAELTKDVARREDLLTRYHAAPLARRATLRSASADDFDRTQSWASADSVDYFLVDGPPGRVQFSRFEVLPTRRFTPDQTIEAITCVIAIALLLFPAVRGALLIYWPAMLLALGVGWLRWSDLPIVGFLFLLAACVGTVWIIRGWFNEQLEPLLFVDSTAPVTKIVGVNAAKEGGMP